VSRWPRRFEDGQLDQARALVAQLEKEGGAKEGEFLVLRNFIIGPGGLEIGTTDPGYWSSKSRPAEGITVARAVGDREWASTTFVLSDGKLCNPKLVVKRAREAGVIKEDRDAREKHEKEMAENGLEVVNAIAAGLVSQMNARDGWSVKDRSWTGDKEKFWSVGGGYQGALRTAEIHFVAGGMDLALIVDERRCCRLSRSYNEPIARDFAIDALFEVVTAYLDFQEVVKAGQWAQKERQGKETA
jgi:hypothetical protein